MLLDPRLSPRARRDARGALAGGRWPALLVAGASFFLFTTLKSELAPIEDRGTIIGIGIAPEGATLEFTDHYAQQIEELLQQVPEIEQYFVVTGFPVVSQMISFVAAQGLGGARRASSRRSSAELAPRMFGIPGVLAFPINPPSLGQSPVEKPVQFVVQTSQPYAELQKLVDALLAEARDYPGLVNLDTDLKLNKPRAQGRPRPRQGRRTSASRSTPSGARSRPCSAAAR